MKRSNVNEIIRESDAFIRSFGYVLPPFAYWTPEEIKAHVTMAPAIKSARLGWDITDYGQGRFDELGLFLFTVRNGDAAQLAQGRGMLYAEKIMISRKDQLSPMHRHVVKAEDIINRGGGTLVIELFASAPDGSVDPEAPRSTVATDGVPRTFDRRRTSEAFARRERDADARRLACVLGRRRRRADRRGLDRQRRPDRQHLP